jgi:hypothetical protein
MGKSDTIRNKTSSSSSSLGKALVKSRFSRASHDRETLGDGTEKWVLHLIF